jgi:hypothetical protein
MRCFVLFPVVAGVALGVIRHRSTVQVPNNKAYNHEVPNTGRCHTFRFLIVKGESHQCLHKKIAALPAILLHLELLGAGQEEIVSSIQVNSVLVCISSE